jgi:hypothetical protein
MDYISEVVFAGDNLLAREENESIFLSLLGANGSKPFDCVGTIDEVIEAVQMITSHEKQLNRNLFPNLQKMCDYIDQNHSTTSK